MPRPEQYNPAEYGAGRERGTYDAERNRYFSPPADSHRDFLSGYSAAYYGWFADPCDNRAERYATSNAYDR